MGNYDPPIDLGDVADILCDIRDLLEGLVERQNAIVANPMSVFVSAIGKDMDKDA